MKISQRELADKMQLIGIDIDKNAIQRIECGKRFVTDIEIVSFAKVFQVEYKDLLNWIKKANSPDQSVGAVVCCKNKATWLSRGFIFREHIQ